ncbi:L-threonylcarbamoyladenylate synthase [Nitrososphaera sp.]|uniref:L-threonylcarbamoyladenylate synthase n=1 Tax=Nitrososphaera sp. TaxID=1971748 RepID=UPI0017A9DA00|nr:L-threonylcarbamoyladenylate synthase [Nitrososphaera sp.]NWG37251.1 threonylcarbamoyl-AMP synthase [Nitrososphaera sp.]
MHETLDCTDAGIERCAQIVKAGGVVVFPTDTVYGIGCDPHNDAAVRRVFAIKGREEKKPLPVLAASIGDAEKIVILGPRGRALAEKFWPGALTIVAPLKDRKISQGVTAGKDSLAVRVPANRCVLGVLKICKYLVGTSANQSGMPAPRDAQSVLKSLSGFDAILADRELPAGRESTVVDASGPDAKIVRQGAISQDAIRKVLADARL